MGRIKEHAANERRVRDVLRAGYRNVVKCSKAPAETSEHRNVKWILASYCWDNGLNFRTEVEFSGGQGRADFIVEEWGTAIEVLKSEDLKEFLSKNPRYEVRP